jgi:RND family efflux transporter MFP subunit
LANVKISQDTTVQNSYSTLLNTAIAAVPGSGNSGNVTPTISGTYNGTDQGQYVVSIYSTGEGLKFKSTGLEAALGDVKNQPVALGTNGLYIQFSATPSAGDSWTIAIPNTFSASYVPNYNAYQSAQKTRDSAIAAAQGQLDSAQAALIQLQAQARPADVQAAQAQILIAQGQVQAASAAYENTLIKTPFDGDISALPVKLADLVTAGQKIVSVVNQGGLQIKVFVSAGDLAFIKTGAVVQIGDTKATGTVSNIAGSVDASTKTAEADIAVTNPADSGLTVGQNVAVIILGGSATVQNDEYILPLQAVKLTPDDKAFVYILDSSGKAQEVAVTIGSVDGEHVEVTSGLSNDMQIVSNAYDVSAGDTVEIQK